MKTMMKNSINKLEELRKRLNQSSLERTAGLLNAMGEDCNYYTKSLAGFINKDLQDLTLLIEECYNLIRRPE